MTHDRTFQQDVEFLRKYTQTIVLRGADGQSLVAVVPAYQGRAMTSSATGGEGTSFGWINYDHVASGEIAPHINVYGGEERFWLGPEGGQFSIFFAPGAEFDLAHWQTPAPIDTDAYDVVSQSDDKVSFRKTATLCNYSGTVFSVRVDRDIELLSSAAAAASLEVDLGDVRLVGYRTTNRVTNVGKQAWSKETGLLSIWLLGMYKPGPETTVVIPYRTGPESALGPVLNDAYFGKVPATHLKVDNGVIYLSGNGQYRSKIGVSPRRSQGICGSFDAERNVLTIVKYNQPPADVTDYVNSMWELQDQPFAGDALNAYNDGPPAPGAKPLGPFYELETSSPALALQPGQVGTHISETYHFQGDVDQLDRLSQALLGVSLAQINDALE